MSIGTLDLERRLRPPVSGHAWCAPEVQSSHQHGFPANQTILVYAATYQETIANVNDTTIMAAINSAWYVNSVSIY